MKLSAIFLVTMTDLSSSWLDTSNIIGYAIGLAGIFATWYFYKKEKRTRFSCDILLYVYKFGLYYRELIGKVNTNSWHRGKKGSDLQTEILVLCADANPFLPKLETTQKRLLEDKLAKVTDYLTSFVSGTDESKDEMLMRMNEVDKYLQQLAEETK